MAFVRMTLDDFLTLWRRIYPSSYTRGIETEAGGQGLDVYAQQAAQFARAAEAIDVSTQAYYLRSHSIQTAPPAGGALRALVDVAIARAPIASGTLTLIAGTEVRAVLQAANGTLVDGPTFRLLTPVTWAAGEASTKSTTVEAVRVGYQGNIIAGTLVAFVLRGRATVENVTIGAGNALTDSGVPDRFTAGMIGQYVRIPALGTTPRQITDVTQLLATTTITVDGAALPIGSGYTVEVEEFEDLGLTLSNAAPGHDGRHGWLDAIGDERRVGRRAGESDEAYRARLQQLDDNISPNAIRRIAEGILSPLAIPFVLMETRDPGVFPGFRFDIDALDNGGFSDGIFLVDLESSVRFFIIRVGLSDAGDFGAFYDVTNGPAMNTNAWDVMFLDGYAVGFVGTLARLWDAVNNARLAGVHFQIVVDPTL